MSHIFTTVTEPREVPAWATNAAQERLEERAEEEFRTGAKPFRDWIADSEIDVLDLAALMSAAARVFTDDGRNDVANEVADFLLAYKQYRANDGDELAYTLADVMADARDE
jgi:hypothetical protein